MFDFLQHPIQSQLSSPWFWLHNIADFIIGSCYLVVGIVFCVFIYQNRKKIPYQGIFFVLVLYILTNGVGYFIEITQHYLPMMHLLVIWKVLAAIVAIVTAIILIFVIPKMILIRAKEENSEQKITEPISQQDLIEKEAKIAKDLFLANMSHEIRTPINGIIGFIELLIHSELTIQQYDYISKMKTASYSLLNIVNDILDFSKIEAQKITPKNISFQLHDILEDIEDIFTHTAFDKGIDLVIDSRLDFSTSFVGDPMWLRQVLINLVGNAIKFTQQGKVIVIVALNTKTNKIKFAVKDSGIGISPEYIHKLFKPFTQEDSSSTRRHGGTGLGLSISKQLVELMGGKISVDSKVGKGATFHFSLPLTKGINVKDALIRKGKMKGKKALIIDNDGKYLSTIKKMMLYFGFDIDDIFDLDFDTDNETHYDIIICNGNIGKYEDLDVVNKIKSYSSLSLVPIIILGNFVEQQKIGKLYELGTNAFLIKPVKISVLFDAIIEVFGKTKTRHHITQKIWAQKNIKSLKNTRILLVEDNRINQQVAQELLTAAEIKVFIANNGKEALVTLKKHEFDLVLMDVQMPEMDGYETTQKIRKHKKFKELPIIAMTAYAMVGDKEKCISAGMDDYLTKPIEPDMLFSMLMKWLKTSDTAEKIIPLAVSTNLRIASIDTKSGLYRTGNNHIFFEKLLVKYAQQYENIVKKINEAVHQNELEQLKKIVHEIKGVSANIGAFLVEESARELEKNMTTPNVQIFITQLCNSIEQTVRDINQSDIYEVRDKEKLANTSSQSLEKSQDLLEELELQLQKSIPSESLKILEKLKEQYPERQLELQKLESLVKKYKFREAKKLNEHIWQKEE